MKKEIDNNENEALNKTDFKCRFFAQYIFSSATLYIDNPNGGGTFCRIVLNTLSQINEKSYLELKLLSN